MPVTMATAACAENNESARRAFLRLQSLTNKYKFKNRNKNRICNEFHSSTGRLLAAMLSRALHSFQIHAVQWRLENERNTVKTKNSSHTWIVKWKIEWKVDFGAAVRPTNWYFFYSKYKFAVSGAFACARLRFDSFRASVHSLFGRRIRFMCDRRSVQIYYS